MGRWYLVRHGKTAWNAEGRIQGQSDTPLSKLGAEQARRLAARLASVDFAAAYSSDLSRALETATIALQGRAIPIVPVPELREISYGLWEGLTSTEAGRRFAAEYAEMMRMSTGSAMPGGESPAQVIERTRRVRDRLLAAHGHDGDLLIVGHSGSIKGLLVALLDLPVEAFWRFRLLPSSISIVGVHNPGATLDGWNDTAHLEGLDG